MNKSNTATALRSVGCWERYQERRSENEETNTPCFLCYVPDTATVIERYNNWVIIENEFPYDTVAEVHHLLAPDRHISHEAQLTKEEEAEYQQILTVLDAAGEYDMIARNFTVGQSHPSHLHYHLITWKRL